MATERSGKFLVSFSGGRSSAYMTWKLLEEGWFKSDELVVVFANTGKEREETLLFVDRCAKDAVETHNSDNEQEHWHRVVPLYRAPKVIYSTRPAFHVVDDAAAQPESRPKE